MANEVAINSFSFRPTDKNRILVLACFLLGHQHCRCFGASCYPAPDRGTGYCFRSISCFVSLFISLSARLQENGWTDLHEIFREGVEWPRDDLIKFRVNSDKWVGGSKVNSLSSDLPIWFDCWLLAVPCCHLETENVMKLLFWPFAASQYGGGLCCASHHSLLLSDFQIPNTFPFLNWSQLNFGYWLVTIFMIVVPCRIFKLSPI